MLSPQTEVATDPAVHMVFSRIVHLMLLVVFTWRRLSRARVGAWLLMVGNMLTHLVCGSGHVRLESAQGDDLLVYALAR